MDNIILKDSKYQEQVIEYQFLSELMFSLSKLGKRLEILRGHADLFGYDLILKIDNCVRFIQLKSRKDRGDACCWDIRKSLINDHNGRFVVVFFEITEDRIILKYSYLPLDKREETASSKPKSKRKDQDIYCQVKLKNLIKADSVDNLASWMFDTETYSESNPHFKLMQLLKDGASKNLFSHIENPAEWQREMRKERSLPGRES